MSPAQGSAPSPRTRRYRAALALAVLAGALLRWSAHRELAAADPAFAEPLLDGRMFLDWAGRIAAGDWLGEGPFLFNPLYPYLIAPVVAVAGDGALAVLRLLQAGMGLATLLLVAGTTRLFLGRRAAAVAAFLAAAWPATIFFEQLALGATVGVFLNALGLWLLARWRRRPTRGRLLGAGVVLGLCVVHRPNALLFAAALPAWFPRVVPGGSSRLRRVAGAAALLFLGVSLPLLPVVVRNLAVVGEPILTTSSMGANLHLCNNRLSWESGAMDSPEFAFSPFLMEAASREVAEARSGRVLSPSGVSAWWTRRTLSDCAREPGPAARFLLRKALYLCGSHELPSSDSFRQAREDSPTLRLLSVPLAFGIAFPFAILGALSVVGRRRRALPLVIMVLAYGASLVAFIPLAHYRAPLLPAFLPLAACGAVMAAGALRGRRTGTAPAIAIALVVAAAAFSHGNRIAAAAGVPSLGPWPETGIWVLAIRAHALVDGAGEAASKGDAVARDRGLRLAEAQARRALAAHRPGEPGIWVVHAALARVAGARGLLVQEAIHVDEGLASSPGEPRLLLDRAGNLLRRGLREEAIAAARAARDAGAALTPELLSALEAPR